ncbi:MAG: IspD/TarI family cytidylyltransferase [Nitrospirota bacterium]
MKKQSVYRDVIAIIPAAGKGERFGPGTNKPFHILGGKTLILWSLEVLETVDEIVEIIPVLKANDIEQGRKVFKENSLSKIRKIAPGGQERQDSVYNGLKLVKNRNCLVLIHDGARPFIEKGLIEKIIKELVNPSLSPFIKGLKRGGEENRSYDGVILGVPLKDTIKQSEDGIITKTLKRDSLWSIQTPQLFPYETIFSAYNKAMEEGFYSTDDAALVERYGGTIKVIMGSYKNIKITTPEDMDLAEFLISK